MKDVGLTENRITLLWDSAHPTTIDGRDNLTAAIHDAQADGVRITLDIYPTRAKALTESPVAPESSPPSRRLVARTFPTGQGLHHRQRAEQVALLAAAVQPERHARRLLGVRARARSVLRRAEVGRPLDHRGRRRSRPARHGQPARARGTSRSPRSAASPTSGRAYRAQQADEADHGRAQLPPVSERVHGQDRHRLRVAERGDPGPRAHQAGRLGTRSTAPGSRRSRRPACRTGRRARSSCG